MGFEQDFDALLRAAIDQNGQSGFAKKAGIVQSNLSEYLSGKRKGFSLQVVGKMVDALGYALKRSDNFVTPSNVPESELLIENADLNKKLRILHEEHLELIKKYTLLENEKREDRALSRPSSQHKALSTEEQNSDGPVPADAVHSSIIKE